MKSCEHYFDILQAELITVLLNTRIYVNASIKLDRIQQTQSFLNDHIAQLIIVRLIIITYFLEFLLHTNLM